jgi:hypothetical protein
MMSFKHGRGHGNPFISRMAKHWWYDKHSNEWDTQIDESGVQS